MPIALPSKKFIDPIEECSEDGRLLSFSNWPYDDSTICAKNRMAEAGFFSLDDRDSVKCFSCSVVLNDWNPETDNPFKKHVELSPNCLFAKLGKLQKNLNVGELIDVMCQRSLSTVDKNFEKLLNREYEFV